MVLEFNKKKISILCRIHIAARQNQKNPVVHWGAHEGDMHN